MDLFGIVLIAILVLSGFRALTSRSSTTQEPGTEVNWPSSMSVDTQDDSDDSD